MSFFFFNIFLQYLKKFLQVAYSYKVDKNCYNEDMCYKDITRILCDECRSHLEHPSTCPYHSCKYNTNLRDDLIDLKRAYNKITPQDIDHLYNKYSLAHWYDLETLQSSIRWVQRK